MPIPRPIWTRVVRANARKIAARLGFMSRDHHRVRDHVVLELPRAGTPLPPESIAERVELPVERVRAILDELERRLTFLFRNERGEVTWAYPVTLEETPHRARFSTGEETYSP
jgi:hypothetical protein